MKIQLWTILFFSLFVGTSLIAQEKKEKKDLQTKSVSIFKNGTAFFIKEGKVKTEKNSYIMSKDIPRALFGTFWIHSPNNDLKYVSSYMDYVSDKTEQMAVSFLDMIHANKGKKIQLHIGKDEKHEGVVEEVIMKNAKGEETSVMNSSLIVFKTASEWLTFSPSEIRRIEFLEKPNQLLERETTTQKNILEVKFNSDKKEQPLEMMYLENGLNWTPTYLIELKDETSAKLSLRAEVTNGAEDIENADMNFVVGIPNFKYANRLSSLVDFLGMIYPQNRNYATQTFSNAIVSPSVEYAEEDMFTSGGSTFNTNLGNGVRGDGDEDLYFYNIRNITLKNGGRGQYPIFSKDVNIAHIYECNLQGNPNTGGYYQKDFLFSPDQKNPVYHSIKLKNNLAFPWTTGSAMVVSNKSGGTRPISQDLLKYTPIKGDSYVKLTESPDIKVKHAEKEVAREEKKKKAPGNSRQWYDWVTVEGQVKVKSYKDKKVDLNIKRTIVGDLKKSNIKWLKAERVNRSGAYNKTSDVCWETSINPGEELIIDYSYQLYVLRTY